MKKAVFMDYMGTLVTENSQYVQEVINRCFTGSTARTPDEIFGFWFMEHDRQLAESYGENFRTEYELSLQTFEVTKEKFGGSENPADLCDLLTKHWTESPAFEDVKKFFKKCRLPVYLVTNNDTKYLEEGLKNNGIKPAGVITSEMAKAYKPRTEIFEMALEMSGCSPEEVIHVGDSLHGDMEGAKEAGIDAYMILRDGKKPVAGIPYVESLKEVLKKLK